MKCIKPLQFVEFQAKLCKHSRPTSIATCTIQVGAMPFFNPKIKTQVHIISLLLAIGAMAGSGTRIALAEMPMMRPDMMALAAVCYPPPSLRSNTTFVGSETNTIS